MAGRLFHWLVHSAAALSRAKVRGARLLHPPTWTPHGSTLCARSQASPISPTAAAAIEEEYLSSCLGELELPPALLSVPPEERPAVGPCLYGCRAPVKCLQSQLAEMFSAKVRPHHISPKLEYSALLQVLLLSFSAAFVIITGAGGTARLLGCWRRLVWRGRHRAPPARRRGAAGRGGGSGGGGGRGDDDGPEPAHHPPAAHR